MGHSGNKRRDIEVRLRKARGYDDTTFGTPHDTIARRLKNLYVTRSKLLSWKRECEEQRKQIDVEIFDANKNLDIIEGMIAELESKKGKLVITEHAILRFLQREKGVDMEAVCEEIRKLEGKKVVRRGNVIITVNGDPEKEGALAKL